MTSIYNKGQKASNAKRKQPTSTKELMSTCANGQKVKDIEGKQSKSQVCISRKVNDTEVISHANQESIDMM